MKNAEKMNIDFASLKDTKILCAVSGGADSMCLLHLLHSAGLDVTAAHFEHGIRGGESLRDMEFVESYCKEQDIPFVCGRADVPHYARENSLGLEEAARTLRYEFLDRKLRELALDYIATAHNADDNAETLIFNLARGSGSMGLRGIPPRRGNIIRPLIRVSRGEIEAYLEENNVPHVEDSTNQSEDYTRNLIRRRIMPVMREINPRFAEAAGRSSMLCARDEDCLSQMARDFVDEHYDGESIPADRLKALHPALASRVLRQLLPGLGMEHVERLMALCRETELKALDLPGRTLHIQQGRLYLSPPEVSPLPCRRLEVNKELFLPECGLAVLCEICVYMGEVNDLFKTSYIKYEMIGTDLCVNSRQNGDRLRPLGRGCSKTLKALFMEHKYPQHKRDSCPVIRDGQGILMVYGIAMDERCRPEKGEKALKLSFRKIKSDTGEKNNAERY